MFYDRFKVLLLIALFCFGNWNPAWSEDYEVEVSTVTVWLRALDSSGAPLKGLQSKDFVILEDGNRVESTCFEEVSLEEPESPEATPIAETAGTMKKFVLFLDLYNVSPAEMGFIRPRLREFLQQIQGKGEVMIAALVPPGKLGVVAQYTSDFQKITAIINQAKGNGSRDADAKGNEDKIVSVLEEISSEEDPPESVDDLTRVSPQIEMNSRLFISAFNMAHAFMREDIRRAELSVKALESFGNYLSSKHQGDHVTIVYLSGGYSGDPGRRYYDLINKFADDHGLTRNAFVFAVRVPNSKKQESFDVHELVKDAIGRLNRLNVTVYAVNTRGMALSRDNTSRLEALTTDVSKMVADFQDPLIQIANETGGLSFHNSQNFQVGFDSILSDLQHHYVLCYTAPEHKKKGKYHEIKISAGVPGIKLRHRRGYVH
jgi:VWFA-related protein